ncbi:protein NRT1/ PTR FAMILY 5.5-like [Salvia splendens]|uniref:protein NRT1/ PTR FAMILY 5.5-like n=1 Tax=Salvia splendens TaxID=180675 RepID=UPI001104B4F3|nr:protein NRT1/ PTR FAMILY 5.5-like [Salvia splendens]
MSGCIHTITNFIKSVMILWPKFPDALVHRIFFVMQAYLTNGWRLSFTHAGAIMNFWEGMSLILPIFLQFMADTFLGNLVVASVSTLFSFTGIGMVALSVPRILDNHGGRCPSLEAESCVNHTQVALFFTGMVLIAIGRAGISFSLDALHDEQNADSNCCKTCFTTCLNCAVRTDKYCIHLVGSLLIFICIRKWKLLFGIPAVYSAYMGISFLCGTCCYIRSKPKGSPIATACRVIYAAATSNNKSQQRPDGRKPSFAIGRFPRCLNRVLATEGESADNVRRFEQQRVETAGFIVRMVPISMTFLVCGMVSSIGNTYFVEQANHMNRKVGSWNVPLLALQLPVIFFKFFHDMWLSLFFKCSKNKLSFAITGIASAMFYSVVCCITAAGMEMKRLKVIRKYGLLDKPDDEVIPMHAAWLLLQFFLLAGLDSFLRTSILEFYKGCAPEHLQIRLRDENGNDGRALGRYLDVAVDFVSGLGFLWSVLSVYIVGKLSNWFKYTLNRSRLDRYYWLLAGLSAVNLLVFTVVASVYKRKENTNRNRG